MYSQGCPSLVIVQMRIINWLADECIKIIIVVIMMVIIIAPTITIMMIIIAQLQ